MVIIKGHGTVAIGKNFQEAFLITDLLEEAVHCQFFKERVGKGGAPPAESAAKPTGVAAAIGGKSYALFSQEHMQALVDSANQDSQFRADGADTEFDDIVDALTRRGRQEHGRCNLSTARSPSSIQATAVSF